LPGFKTFSLTTLLDRIVRKSFKRNIVSELKKKIDLFLDLKVGCINLNKGEKGIFVIREWLAKWVNSRDLLKQLPQEHGLKLPISNLRTPGYIALSVSP
jgi:hypothetical protein